MSIELACNGSIECKVDVCFLGFIKLLDLRVCKAILLFADHPMDQRTLSVRCHLPVEFANTNTNAEADNSQSKVLHSVHATNG